MASLAQFRRQHHGDGREGFPGVIYHHAAVSGRVIPPCGGSDRLGLAGDARRPARLVQGRAPKAFCGDGWRRLRWIGVAAGVVCRRAVIGRQFLSPYGVIQRGFILQRRRPRWVWRGGCPASWCGSGGEFAGRGRDIPPPGVVERGVGHDGDRLGFGRRGAYECGGGGLAERSLAGKLGDDGGVLVQRQLTPLYWWPDGAE